MCKFAVYYSPCHGVALVSLLLRCPSLLSTDCIKVKRRGVFSFPDQKKYATVIYVTALLLVS